MPLLWLNDNTLGCPAVPPACVAAIARLQQFDTFALVS